MAVFVGDDDDEDGAASDDDDGDDDDDRSEWSQSYMVKRHYLIVMFRLMIMEVTKLQPNFSTTAIFGTEESGHCVEVTIMGR